MTASGYTRRKWRWANKMSFLKPHIIKQYTFENRNFGTKANPHFYIPSSSVTTSSNIHHPLRSNDMSDSGSMDTMDNMNDDSSLGLDGKDELLKTRNEVDDFPSLLGGKLADDESPMPYTNVVDYFNKPMQERKFADAIDLLFLSYAQTLKTFSERRQAEIKMQISLIMNKAELANIEEKEQKNSNTEDNTTSQ